MIEHDRDRLLARLVPGFRARPKAEFLAKFNDEVGDYDLEVVRETFEDKKKGLTLILLVGGLVVKIAGELPEPLYSLFESQERLDERGHIQAWADFARGRWAQEAPTEPGVYPVRDLAGKRQPDHTFVRHEGRVLDISGGFLQTGKRTNWAGSFWSLAYPPLPGAQ